MKSATATRPITSIRDRFYRTRSQPNERQREILAWLGNSLDDVEKRKLSRQGGVDVSEERLLEVKLMNLARDRYRSLQEKEFHKQRFLDTQQRKMMRTLPGMLDKINLDQYRRKSLSKMEQLREKTAQLRLEILERMRLSARSENPNCVTLPNDPHDNEWDWIEEDNYSELSGELDGSMRFPSAKSRTLVSAREKKLPPTHRSEDSCHALPHIGTHRLPRVYTPKKVSFVPTGEVHTDSHHSLPHTSPYESPRLPLKNSPLSSSVSATSSAVSRRRSHLSGSSHLGSRASSSVRINRVQSLANRQVQSSLARSQATQDPRCQDLLKALVPISRPCSGQRLPGIVQSIDALYLPPKHSTAPIKKNRPHESDNSD